MLYEYISVLLGLLKIYLFKIVYSKRIELTNIPKMNVSFKMAVKKDAKISIGKNFRSRNNVSFRAYNNGRIRIGESCFFNDGCSLNCQEKIEIGNHVICGQNVQFFDHDHDYKNNMEEFVTKAITVGDKVWIGANVTILKGVTIGSNVVIAAGTVVTKDIESGYMARTDKRVIEKRIKTIP